MPQLERSVLSVPGSNWHMIEKAVSTAADWPSSIWKAPLRQVQRLRADSA
jgi:hypothetical protein